jgi:hypothetical protein
MSPSNSLTCSASVVEDMVRIADGMLLLLSRRCTVYVDLD